MTTREVNFDGIGGPTHHYAGLARGNLASQAHAGEASNPRAAAREGLAKMKLVMDLGIEQAVLPPQPRPDVATLRHLGFSGDDTAVLAAAARDAPHLLAACTSASSMWAANAATVSPSADCADGLLHLTPANLASHLHRAIEARFTTAVLCRIFADPEAFVVHDPLPACDALADEGAANHTRLSATPAAPGVELFVHGRTGPNAATRLPARQSLHASAAISRLHRLDPARVVFAQQHPAAIDAGVFHNDVIAVGHRHVLLCHESAWVDQPAVLATLRERFATHCGGNLVVIEVPAVRLPLPRAVATYLFNSQVLTAPDGRMGILCPIECRDDPQTAALLAEWTGGATPLQWTRFVDVRQSMHNGGGPACLRLRVTMTDAQRRRALPAVFLTPTLHQKLVEWVCRHYRDHLVPADLSDPHLLTESRDALDELTVLLGMGAVYDFQR